MKISLTQTEFFDRGEFSGNLYVAKNQKEAFNALLVHCVTGHHKTKLTGAARMYLVLEGEGTFTINDRTETAAKNDLFIIGDGDVYEYEGKMELFEFNVPATDSSNEEKL